MDGAGLANATMHLSQVYGRQNAQRQRQAAHAQQGGGRDQGADLAAVIAHFCGQHIAAGGGRYGGEGQQDGGMGGTQLQPKR